MKLRPMLQVRDVAGASAWYQGALGLRSGHGGDEYEMLFGGEDFLLQLHRLDGDEHSLPTPGDGPAGAGISLWFEAADKDAFVATFERARDHGASVVAEPAWNPVAHHHEATLRDLDGYLVVLHSPFEPPT